MIQAQFDYVGTDCKGCYISGHAEYADPGADVVCAAVSSAVQTVANLMTEVFRLAVEAVADPKTNAVQIALVDTDETGEAAKLFEGLILQLEQIQAQYPTYLQIKKKTK